jgi:hypothetical protein
MPALGPVNELTNAVYTATLRDENGSLVPGSALTAAYLTLCNYPSEEVINGRDRQDILNVNGVTIYNVLQTDLVTGHTYNVRWEMEPDDNAFLGQGGTWTLGLKPTETHHAIFDFQWGLTGRAVHQAVIVVRNVTRTLV